MFFMCQHPLIQKLMNGIKETSLGNRTEKPHQIIIDTGQRNGIISSFKIIVYLSPNLGDTELAKILRPRLFAYRIQGSASCFQQCGLETLEITNERATFGPLLFSFEKTKPYGSWAFLQKPHLYLGRRRGEKASWIRCCATASVIWSLSKRAGSFQVFKAP
jgi:hypothetical protein